MSKIGKNPVTIPAGVEVSVAGSVVTVKWPKGSLTYTLVHGVSALVEDNHVKVSIADIETQKNLRGLTRTLIANMITGVTQWYQKKLLIIWVWYNAQAQGNKIVLSLGYSHKINFDLPASVQATTEQDQKSNTVVTLTSIDKQLLGEVAAKIRDLRSPEPYKGKGVRYFDEEVKLKPGKAAGK